MQLHAIEASRLHGLARGGGEAVNDLRQLLLLECTRRRGGDKLALSRLAVDHKSLGAGHQRRGRDRCLQVGLQHVVGDAAHMPELGDDAPALGMHGIGDFLPGLQLLLAVQTGYVGIALSLVADGRAFADQQTGRGALDVVGLHQRRGYRVGGAVARQRCHGNAVGQTQAACFNRFEQ